MTNQLVLTAAQHAKGLANSRKPLFSMTTVHFCVFPAGNRTCLGQTVHHVHSARGGTAREMLLYEGLFGKELVLGMLCCPVRLHTDQLAFAVPFQSWRTHFCRILSQLISSCLKRVGGHFLDGDLNKTDPGGH